MEAFSLNIELKRIVKPQPVPSSPSVPFVELTYIFFLDFKITLLSIPTPSSLNSTQILTVRF